MPRASSLNVVLLAWLTTLLSIVATPAVGEVPATQPVVVVVATAGQPALAARHTLAAEHQQQGGVESDEAPETVCIHSRDCAPHLALRSTALVLIAQRRDASWWFVAGSPRAPPHL